MTASEGPPHSVPKSLTDDATAAVPRIVNGLTVRPRKQINAWYYALLLLPSYAALLIIVGLGMHRMLRYLDAKRTRES